jgi:hypothetical protein
MPEPAFLGALERAIHELSSGVEATLARAQSERDAASLAGEAEAIVARLRREGGAAGERGGSMAFGIGERPERSVSSHLEGVEYPADRDDLVAAAADNEAPPEVINFLKCLPRDRYDSEEMVYRDFGEAARRYGMHGHAPLVGSVDRRNLGRDAVEENVDGNPRHP